jgi:hypothetical protein
MFLSNFSKALTVLTVSVGVLGSLSPITQAQNTVQSSASFSLQNPTLPNLPSSDPKVKLVTVTCDDQLCGANPDWKKAKISKTNADGKAAYLDYTCSKNGSFAGQTVLGIDDYSDGISLKNFKTYTDPTLLSKVKNEYSNLRMTCQYTNEMAGNNPVYGCRSNLSILSLPTYSEYTAPRPTVCVDPGIKPTPTNNPVYAYQFRYNIKFSESEKAAKSNLYRSMTGLDEVYDGVSMTYTYYTYLQNGKFPWENLNKNNANRGWLVYGNRNNIPPVSSSSSSSAICMLPEGCVISNSIVIGKSITDPKKDRLATLTHTPNTKTLSWKLDLNSTNSCDKVNKSSVILEGTKLVILAEKPVISGGVACTTQVSQYPYSSSQVSTINTTTITNAIRTKNFEVRIKDNIPPVSSSSSSSAICMLPEGCVISNSIVIGKSITDPNKERLATLTHTPNTKTLSWKLDLNSTSGCDKVDKSYFRLEGKRLVIHLIGGKAGVDICTSIASQYTHSNSTKIDAAEAIEVTNAIRNKNFEVRIG